MGIQIGFDEALVNQIADRFDLRAPNRDALRAIVQAIVAAGGEYREMVADLATGVGKTFLMSALVEYLAVQGVRHVLVVTPGSTIQRKTLQNFDAASAKYVPGAEIAPVIVTPDNFQSASMGAALRDSRRLKVFVFNIQLLLRPTDKMSRRTREVDENLGDALYEHLANTDDLFIIADEHHIYHEKAKAFSDAIRQLHPVALVGLTATPDKDDYDKVVFQYTLAEAIADEYVKVPVIVYRKGGIADETTQLRDACRLLEKKEEAYRVYAQANPGVTPVKPCLFVVCSKIEQTEEVGQVLARPGFIGDGQAVLEITSQSSDEALDDLGRVESPDSPIRAIVSVNMLREGWDVRNIAVIVGLRRLASQTLTEQILGRGLRLPFGERTGVGTVDQVDIVAHDSYQQLLSQKNALAQRIEPPAPDIVWAGAPGTPDVEVDWGTGRTTTVSGGMSVPLPSSEGLTGGLFGDDESGAVTVGFADSDTRQAETGPSEMRRVKGAPQITFPRRESRVVKATFDISDIAPGDAEAAGARFTQEPEQYLFHTKLDATREGGKVVVLEENIGHERVDQVLQGLDTVSEMLRRAILDFDEVPRDLATKNGAYQLARTFLHGAGVTNEADSPGWGQVRIRQATEALRHLVRTELAKDRREEKYEIVPVTLPAEPVIVAEPLYDIRRDDYQVHAWFGGWQKSIMPYAQFDAKTTEWALAKMMDSAPEIRWWLRLYTNGQAYVQTLSGRYYPDFIAVDADGTHWLIEGKSDDEARKNQDVQDKKDAAEKWARAIRYDDHWPTWRYLFATESAIKASHDTWDGLIKAANPE